MPHTHACACRASLLLLTLIVNCLPAADNARLSVRVIDGSDTPLAGVRLRIHLWNGRWEPTDVTAISDKSGRAELGGIKTEQYLTLSSEADGYASTAYDMELAVDEQRDLTVRMRRPAHSSVRILDSQDKPIPGAMLSVLHFAAGDGGSLFYRPDGNEPFPFEPSSSDAHGVIKMPPMPSASNVELVVFHPDYLPKKLENLRAIDGELAVIKLDKGVELRFKFELAPGLDSLPKDLRVTTSLSPSTKDGERNLGLYLPMKLTDTQWHCHVLPAKYERLMVRSESDDYTITPRLFADEAVYRSQLHVADSAPHEVSFLVRKNIKLRGKLSGYESRFAAHPTALGWTENLHPQIKSSDSKPQWLPTQYADIGPDGTFEVSLPPGRAKLSFGGLTGAFVEPSEFEFTIEPGKEPVLPEFKVRQLQNITGQLVDENQRPLAGAIARLFAGVWGSEYIQCDQEGRFSLKPDLIVDTARHSTTPLEVSIIAFDPATGKSALQPITQNWQQAQDLVIRCEPRPSGWLIQSIEYQMKKFPHANPEYRQEQLQETLAAFPQASTGQFPPDLSQGTWLNSKATSLKDLRGKYVLLDFWFIGCGPCEAEIPYVKLLQETYGGDRFTVVSVHVTDQTVDNVREYTQQRSMNFPIVVDNEDGEIEQAIRKIGIQGFPTYLLLGPDGRILHNDSQQLGPSLRSFKIEKILSLLR